MSGASTAVGEHLALNALTTELYILKFAQISKDEYRYYVGRSQFPLFVRHSKPHRGVLDFINKGDLLNQTCTMIYAVLNIMGGNLVATRNVTRLFEILEDI